MAQDLDALSDRQLAADLARYYAETADDGLAETIYTEVCDDVAADGDDAQVLCEELFDEFADLRELVVMAVRMGKRPEFGRIPPDHAELGRLFAQLVDRYLDAYATRQAEEHAIRRREELKDERGAARWGRWGDA